MGLMSGSWQSHGQKGPCSGATQSAGSSAGRRTRTTTPKAAGAAEAQPTAQASRTAAKVVLSNQEETRDTGGSLENTQSEAACHAGSYQAGLPYSGAGCPSRSWRQPHGNGALECGLRPGAGVCSVKLLSQRWNLSISTSRYCQAFTWPQREPVCRLIGHCLKAAQPPRSPSGR